MSYLFRPLKKFNEKKTFLIVVPHTWGIIKSKANISTRLRSSKFCNHTKYFSQKIVFLLFQNKGLKRTQDSLWVLYTSFEACNILETASKTFTKLRSYMKNTNKTIQIYTEKMKKSEGDQMFLKFQKT